MKVSEECHVNTPRDQDDCMSFYRLLVKLSGFLRYTKVAATCTFSLSETGCV